MRKAKRVCIFMAVNVLMLKFDIRQQRSSRLRACMVTRDLPPRQQARRIGVHGVVPTHRTGGLTPDRSPRLFNFQTDDAWLDDGTRSGHYLLLSASYVCAGLHRPGQGDHEGGVSVGCETLTPNQSITARTQRKRPSLAIMLHDTRTHNMPVMPNNSSEITRIVRPSM